MENRFNGKVKTILSVDVSDWGGTGILEATRKKQVNESNAQVVRDWSYAEIKNEVWAQLKQSLNVNGKEVLKDDQMVHWYIDQDITVAHGQEDKNKEPLLVNTINSWSLRPDAYTSIPNLFLASDYVRTYTDLATMEGANEAARRAVNAIIEASGVNAPHCKIWNLHEPGILASMRNRDRKRYEQGLPYQFHIPEAIGLFLKIILFIKKLFGRKSASLNVK
jgi:hypothetical protein